MSAQRLTWKWRLIAAIVVGLVRIARWHVHVRGLHNVPRGRGAVLAFNHHSYVDFLMLAWGPVRLLRRPVRFLAKREIFESRWVGWVVRWGEAVPVDRSSHAGRAGAFGAATAALANGDLVAIAPEQTISRSFELLPFRTGVVRMAQEAQVPIIPVVGWGSQRFATKGIRPRLVTRLPVIVSFGEPFHVQPDEDVTLATERLRGQMTRLLHETQEDYPDGAPARAAWVPARLGGGAPRHEDVVRAHEQRIRGWDEGDARPG